MRKINLEAELFLSALAPLLFHRRLGRLIVPAACGRCAWRDREIWMQSEQGRPRTILGVCTRPPCEECAKGRDSFMRTGLACMSTQVVCAQTSPKPTSPAPFPTGRGTWRSRERSLWRR